MTEWKKAFKSREERFVFNIGQEWKKNSTYILLIIFLLVCYYRGITDCNNYYQDVLFNSTFLEERIEYNKGFVNVDGRWMQNPLGYGLELPKHLNTSNSSISLEEVI